MPSRRALFVLGTLLLAMLAAQIALLGQGRGSDRPSEADFAALRSDVKSLGQSLSQVHKRLDRIEDLTTRTASLTADLKEEGQVREARQARETAQAVEAARAQAEPAPTESDPSEPGAKVGGINQVLERLEKMEKKLDRRRGGDDQWKPSTEELSKELGLAGDQEAKVTTAANTAKDQLMALARIPRADGGMFLDDFAEALHQAQTDPGGAQAKFGPLIFRMMAEKVPGREGTYFNEIMAIGAEAHRGFAAAMSPEQYADLQRRNVDVFGIKTGYDPIGDYATAKFGKAK